MAAISFGENVVKKWSKSNQNGYGGRSNDYIHNGRGFLQYNFGMIPMRHHINTIIGAPIHLEKVNDPNNELIKKTHKEFCTQLNELFEAHKSKYVENHEEAHFTRHECLFRNK